MTEMLTTQDLPDAPIRVERIGAERAPTGMIKATQLRLPGRYALVFQLLVLLFMLFMSPRLPLTHAADFLEAEQAFPVTVQGAGQQWLVEFRVADGYYLYRDRIDIKNSDGSAAQAALQSPVIDIPRGKRKFDENLGKEVETLRGTVRIPVSWQGAPPEAIDVHSQGCADAGLCYPPMVQRVKLASIAPLSNAAPLSATDESGALAQRLQSGNKAFVLLAFFGLGVLLAFTPCVLPMVPILSAVIVGQQQSMSSSRWRSVSLAAAYVAGMSIIYTAVGVVAGLTGEGLVAAMQQPVVLFVFAAFLMAFGIAMLGAWDMQLPLSVQNWVNERSQRLQGGQFAPVFVMGGLSAVLVGPCVAPPLAGALLYLSTSGDWLLGGAALMALSWGLGAPLIMAAAAADRVLPRAGAWMESVKRFFGFLLVALAIYTAAPVVSTQVLMAAWCVFLLVSAAWAGALQVLPPQAGPLARVRQGFAWVLLLLGILQGVGAALGADDVFNPLGPLRSTPVAGQSSQSVGAAHENPDAVRSDGASANDGRAAGTNLTGNPATEKPLGSKLSGAKDTPAQLSALQGSAGVSAPADARPAGRHGLPFRVVPSGRVMDVIAQLKQPVMLDFYADWCVSCKEMERFTFTDINVQKALSGVVWLQVDVTDNTPDDKALLKRFRLFGPPGIVFFDAGGQEIANVRVVGFQKAKQFEQTLKAAFAAP